MVTLNYREHRPIVASLLTSARKHAASLAGAFALLACSYDASAVILNNGDDGLALGTAAEAPGTILSNTTVPITGIFDINPASTLQELVVRRTAAIGTLAAGGLDFYFQVSNSGLSTGEIRQTNFNFYGGFVTDVFYDSRGPGVIASADPLNGTQGGNQVPTNNARSNSGESIAFSYINPTLQTPLGLGSVAPGDVSKWMVIRTNATQFGAGMAGIINGITQNYPVLGPVPEPTTMLFGAALIGFTATQGRRLRQRHAV